MPNPALHGYDFVYGIDGSVIGWAIQSTDEEHSFANQATVEDEYGNTITDRSDDRRRNLTLEFKTQVGFNYPALGSTFAWQGVNYIVRTLSDQRRNKEFRACRLTAENLEYITT